MHVPSAGCPKRHAYCRYGQLLVAANLRDSEALMPHLILQLVALLVYFPQQTVYLSVYESGSRDATGGDP
jgi:Cryptococcal mannosyltransferase 1